MEESLSSVKTLHSRKRKKSRQSSLNHNPLFGILTRSKSRIYFHQNRSGISRPDPVFRKPKSFRPDCESVEVFLDVNCNNASRVSSIKDLRMRRVFTPDVNSVIEEEGVEETEDRKKLLKCSDSSRVVGSEVADVKLDELEKPEIIVSKTEDARNDLENGPNLKDLADVKCGRRKVFKTSSSFSYKRLLPYLMDIVNDDSSVSKIEIVDAANPCKLRKLDGVKSEVLSISDKSYTNVKCVVPQFDDTKPSENEDVQKFHTELPFNQQGFSGKENELGQTAETIRPVEVAQKGHESDADNRVDVSVEQECVQMTPPDPGMFTNTEADHGGEYMEANNVLGEKQISKGLSVGSEKSNCDVLRQSPNSKCGTNSVNRTVLNPCSRLRLFKNPRSLSYRRLLPFLMDISKNNSCAPRITQNSMPQVDLKEDLHPVSAATAEQHYVNKIITEEKQHTEDQTQNLLSSMVPLPSSDGSPPDTQNNPDSPMPQSSSTSYSSNAEPSLVTSETLPEPCMLIDTEEMPQSQCNHINSELGLNGEENSSLLSASSTTNNDILSKPSISVEPGSVGKQEICLSMGLELHDNNGGSIEKVSLNQIEVSDALVTPTNGPFKGILKRNRRGCRGLCNCLNCASFRLHADRAFEFSRNQMHDAEEVASDLMKELANLRSLLEKSVITDNDLAAIQLNPVLIKQACNKAVETENLAKERLSQLNYDLNVHCRIPTLLQPKVTFANYIEERAIPVLDPSTST
ncbi:hypothetical protein DH2020_005028 [Rehmannia glutinosa]|uniref:Uncharacterized protein n=1 Tax=Rehmannia glutinosa TaxID=99300 RepID=A0ABR0XR39_REHGL